MPRISVVVPIFDVEDYLEECLRSVAGQTFEDLEVVMVDDGSTDGSARIAERFARHDGRFRLVSQPNGGLGRARNTGIANASGEFLAFLDSDDVLPPDAYRLLHASLARTGSCFATGNVHRLSEDGTRQAPFLAKAFARSRARTHVRRFDALLADRTACNKLWRRSFWCERALRFPEGRLHEDIPVVVPAHFEARAVDVVAAPVYHWRIRRGGAPSITQRRRELRALLDRFAAVEEVHAYLARHESRTQRRRYARSVVAGDLRYHLDLLDDASEEYRDTFVERATAFLEDAGPGICDRLPAIERLKWRLVTERRVPELLELLRFQRERALRTRPTRSRGRYYAAYPVKAPVPRAATRLGRGDPELALTAHLEDLRFEDGKLRLYGHAYVNALGASRADSQQVAIGAVRPGRLRPVRMRLGAKVLPTRSARRPDLDPAIGWSGFRAALDVDDLLRDEPPGDARWELFAHVRTGPVRRRRAQFVIDDPRHVRAVELPGPPDLLVQASLDGNGHARVTVATRWLRVESHRLAERGLLELSGTARLAGIPAPELELTRIADRLTLRFPITVADGGFRAIVPLDALRVAPYEARASDAEWELRPAAGAGRPQLVLASELSGAAWRTGTRDLSLVRTDTGGARLLERELVPRPVPSIAADGSRIPA
jgi:CDP-glycerol glycerophosphotransferase